VRFYKEETKNEPGFAEKMAANADLFVLDAFGTAHRAHASTEGVTKFLKPNVAGFLLQKVRARRRMLASAWRKPVHARGKRWAWGCAAPRRHRGQIMSNACYLSKLLLQLRS
jgi:Phosphoglycerate kinase